MDRGGDGWGRGRGGKGKVGEGAGKGGGEKWGSGRGGQWKGRAVDVEAVRSIKNANRKSHAVIVVFRTATSTPVTFIDHTAVITLHAVP